MGRPGLVVGAPAFLGSIGTVLDVDIPPARMTHVATDERGQTVVIEAEAGNVAHQLKEIDRSLVLRWHELPAPGHYSVLQVLDDGSEHLVTCGDPIPGGAPHPGLVERVRRARPGSGWDAVEEAWSANEQLRRDAQRQLEEEGAERSEPIYHAWMKAQGANQNRIFVPRGVRR